MAWNDKLVWPKRGGPSAVGTTKARLLDQVPGAPFLRARRREAGGATVEAQRKGDTLVTRRQDAPLGEPVVTAILPADTAQSRWVYRVRPPATPLLRRKPGQTDFKPWPAVQNLQDPFGAQGAIVGHGMDLWLRRGLYSMGGDGGVFTTRQRFEGRLVLDNLGRRYMNGFRQLYGSGSEADANERTVSCLVRTLDIMAGSAGGALRVIGSIEMASQSVLPLKGAPEGPPLDSPTPLYGAHALQNVFDDGMRAYPPNHYDALTDAENAGGYGYATAANYSRVQAGQYELGVRDSSTHFRDMEKPAGVILLDGAFGQLPGVNACVGTLAYDALNETSGLHEVRLRVFSADGSVMEDHLVAGAARRSYCLTGLWRAGARTLVASVTRMFPMGYRLQRGRFMQNAAQRAAMYAGLLGDLDPLDADNGQLVEWRVSDDGGRTWRVLPENPITRPVNELARECLRLSPAEVPLHYRTAAEWWGGFPLDTRDGYMHSASFKMARLRNHHMLVLCLRPRERQGTYTLMVPTDANNAGQTYEGAGTSYTVTTSVIDDEIVSGVLDVRSGVVGAVQTRFLSPSDTATFDSSGAVQLNDRASAYAWTSMRMAVAPIKGGAVWLYAPPKWYYHTPGGLKVLMFDTYGHRMETKDSAFPTQFTAGAAAQVTPQGHLMLTLLQDSRDARGSGTVHWRWQPIGDVLGGLAGSHEWVLSGAVVKDGTALNPGSSYGGWTELRAHEWGWRRFEITEHGNWATQAETTRVVFAKHNPLPHAPWVHDARLPVED